MYIYHAIVRSSFELLVFALLITIYKICYLYMYHVIARRSFGSVADE